MKDIIYPSSPVNADNSALRPTREYKAEIVKVSTSVVLFAAVYLLLVALSVGLAIGISYLGIQLIVLRPMFLTLMIGAGMIGLGIMVVYFLIKFIFAVKRVDRSDYYEIKEADFPDLFAFIRQLAGETKTPMSKRVYLTAQVNASVFYDSSFFSMFLPVRKNLLIGLGFVNSVNLSEFKAVLAHEFGHFSQHSMTLGSYVFNVNKIIYNMLYDNKGYSNALESWASASSYFVFFAKLTIKIVEVIQKILQKVYVIVNKTNLSLSRQMEHHADAVSAFVSGPNHLISALNRLEIADSCYNQLLNSYDKWIADNLKPDNLFPHHKEMITHFATENDYTLSNGLPVINRDRSSISHSRIMVKDQWASHPSNRERDNYLQTLRIDKTEVVTESPWILFGDAKKIQQTITDKLYTHINFKGTVQVLDFVSFKEKYYNEFNGNSYPKEYRGYYNNRKIEPFDPEITQKETSASHHHFSAIFSKEHCAMPSEIQSVRSDKELLNAIELKQYDIKSFEFDGKKYGRKDIPALKELLEKDEKNLQQKIDDLDRDIFKFFISLCNATDKNILMELYRDYFTISAESAISLKNYTELSQTISPIYSQRLPVTQAQQIIDEVKSIEKTIVNQMKEVLPQAKEQHSLDEKQFEKLDAYLSKDRYYFSVAGFDNKELDVFNEAMNIFLNLMFAREFQAKKKILLKQLELLENSNKIPGTKIV